MSRADYAHWNEEADAVWWAEEGRHVEDEPVEYDDHWYAGDEDPEHQDLDDCIRDSSFNLPSSTGIWECACCGEQFPRGTPEEVSAHTLRKGDVISFHGGPLTVVYNDDHGKRVLIGVEDAVHPDRQLFFRATDKVWRV